MPRLVLTFVTLLFATAAHAQAPSQAPGFFDQKPTTWAPRGQLSPLGTEVRDIPIKRIRADWCGATEYTKELFGKELVENGKNALDEYGLSFSLDGSFDGSGVKQTALVGNYETCRGRRGRFVLIIDSDTRKVRFLDVEPARHPFAALGKESATAFRVMYCLECDISSVVRWDVKRKRFVIGSSRAPTTTR